MKTVLITGAGGFIGSFLVEKSLEEGYRTFAGVRASTSREYLQNPAIQFVDLNFADTNKLSKQLTDLRQQGVYFDVIIHNMGVTKCSQPEDFYRINYLYLRHFIEALQTTEMMPKQFIYMSSLSSIGCPHSCYGKSKLMSENLLQSMQEVPWVIMRPTGVYGPREKDYLLLFKTINRGFDVAAGFQTQHLSFIYIKDLVASIFQIIDKNIKHQCFTISDGATYTNKEVRQIASQILHQSFVIPITIPLFFLKVASIAAEFVAKQQGKSSTLNRDKYLIMKKRNWDCDITLLQEKVGFSPQYNLSQGLQETIAWYKEHGWL